MPRARPVAMSREIERVSAPPPAVAATAWVAGEVVLRVRGRGFGGNTVLAIGRPWATVGRDAAADVRIDDEGVAGVHAFLFLDERGLFAVDLATRGGTRVGPRGAAAAWLRPGDALEVTGRFVEVLDARVGGAPIPALPPREDPLGDASAAALARVTLAPDEPGGGPWAVGSELAFAGRSPACGVPAPGALRVHAAIVRRPRGAFLVNLAGRDAQLNGEPVAGAVPLRDGDRLRLGPIGFRARVEGPPGTAIAPAPAPGAEEGPLPSDAGEDPRAALAWMLAVLQEGQEEILRRQEEFQRALAGALGRMHREQEATLRKHLDGIEAIQRDLAALREEVRDRFTPAGPPPAAGPPAFVPPSLRVANPPPPPVGDPGAAAWLIARARQHEQETRSAWRELLGRLTSGPPPEAP